ncbi:hypothetical protein R5R35_003519 [Gryllus longicercus]|uniref:Uncharacterized protein n=1 Tax=Gryllus longicercus TaxID=2509291 RepID=A0AAN9VMK1_9ORTH
MTHRGKATDASSSIESSYGKSTASKLASTHPDLIIEGDVQILGSVETPSEVLSIKYTSGYQYLAVGMTNGTIDLYTMPTGVLVRNLAEKDKGSVGPVTNIKHGMTPLHVRNITATHVDGTIKCWDIHSGSIKYSIREKRQVLGLAYHPQLAKFITFGEDARIHLYDEESSCLEGVYEPTDLPEAVDGHVSRVFSGCFNPAMPYEFITGGWDDTIQVWDTRVNQSIRHMSGAHICGDGLDINSSGKQVVSFSWQKTNPHQLWDYATGKLLMNFEVDTHNSMLYCGQFLPKDVMVMGGTDQNLIRIVDKSNLTAVCRIRNLPVGVYSLDVGGIVKRKTQPKTPDLVVMPKISFCSGKKVYEFDFSI